MIRTSWAIAVTFLGLFCAVVAFPAEVSAGPAAAHKSLRIAAFQSGLVANDDSYTTPMNTTLTVPTASGVLANDPLPRRLPRHTSIPPHQARSSSL